MRCCIDTPGACALRLVCRDFQAAVTAHPWEDRETVIKGSIGGWRACFPWARCANVRMWVPGGVGVVRRTPVADADFVHLEGLRELHMAGCKAVTDAAFAHLRGIHTLNMSGCSQPTITAAAFQHLAGISQLSMHWCSPLAIAAARAAGLPVTA